MVKGKFKEIKRTFLNKPLIVKRKLLQANKRNEVWLKDSSRIIPYQLKCHNCEECEISIEMTEEFFKNWTYHYEDSPKIDKDELIKLGGGGQFYKYLECENCESIYYIGIGIIEPNYGRDVIVLHCIWEVEEKFI